MNRDDKITPGVKGVIFDMDGVVVDSEEQFSHTEPQILAEIVGGYYPDLQNHLVGLGPRASFEYLLKRFPVTCTFEEFERRYEESAELVYGKLCKPIPNVVEYIQNARKLGIKTGLCSSTPHKWISVVLDRFDLRKSLDSIVSSDDTSGVGKPDPAVYKMSLSNLGLEAWEVFAVEDSKNGVRSCKSAGITCVGLLNGYNRIEDLAEADRVVEDIRLISLAHPLVP